MYVCMYGNKTLSLYLYVCIRKCLCVYGLYLLYVLCMIVRMHVCMYVCMCVGVDCCVANV